MTLANLRREYSLTSLRRSDLETNPIAQFQKWFEQTAGARRSGRLRGVLIRLYKAIFMLGGTEAVDLNAATLATANREGRPSSRVVLLKGVDERGFIFFTNYESRKGRELSENPYASMTFYWTDQERQVCISGEVAKIPREESVAYFKSRPRASQLAAWASHQSEVIENRDVIENRWKEMEAKFPGDVPMPANWGGSVLNPERIEFWQGRPGRLHDRFRYVKNAGGGWKIDRLSP